MTHKIQISNSPVLWLTITYDKCIYLLEPSPVNQKLIGQCISFLEYPDGTVDIDRDKLSVYGVRFNDVADIISTSMGSMYINDFSNQDRMQQVIVQLNAESRMEELNITYDCIASDHWESFIKIFKPYLQGKYHTVGIEGNNCRLRHRIKRAVRRTCCFSKKVLNHIKAFNLGFFYINHGFI